MELHLKLYSSSFELVCCILNLRFSVKETEMTVFTCDSVTVYTVQQIVHIVPC